MNEVLRALVVPDVDADGMIIQPDFGDDLAAWAALEVIENHRRDGAAVLGDYANRHGNGRARGYDPKGNYACGDCNRHIDDDQPGIEKGTPPRCSLMAMYFRINLKSGSCMKWEDLCAGDPETFFGKIRAEGQYTAEQLGYGVALAEDGREGDGFGCHVCDLQEPAIRVDSKGRIFFCRWWGARVDPTDCCRDNDAPSTSYDGNTLVTAETAET